MKLNKIYLAIVSMMSIGGLISLVSCNNSNNNGEEEKKEEEDPEIIPPTNLGENYTWDEISEIAGDHPEETFKVGDYLNIQFPYQDTSDSVGGIIVDDDNNEDGILENDGNEVYQTVRIIGFNHDDVSNTKKAGITFQFVNFVSDQDGYSIATLYNDIDDADISNYDFTDCSLRKALTGAGSYSNNVGWYQKSNTSRSSSSFTDNVSILDLLPADLSAVIQPVIKKVDAYNTSAEEWSSKTFTDKLFLLSKNEIEGNDSGDPNESEQYQYYQEHNKQEDRITSQIKKNSNAVHRYTRVVDNHYYTDNTYEGKDDNTTYYYEENKGYNFAGYNYDNVFGGLGWLRSPYINEIIPGVDIIHNDGSINNYNAHATILAVAPAFCI